MKLLFIIIATFMAKHHIERMNVDDRGLISVEFKNRAYDYLTLSQFKQIIK